jgi:small subunit ribosomal protein S4
MGDPKFSRKKYGSPTHPWQAGRIKEENELIKKYGLKNKREVWRTQSLLRNFRRQARLLFPKLRIGDKQAEKEAKQLIGKLTRFGILQENATLDDVLALDVETIFSRRFQTLLYIKGLASTPKQARQLIVHGHAAISRRKVTLPGYLVRKDEELSITYSQNSPLNNEAHPVRPKVETPVVNNG